MYIWENLLSSCCENRKQAFRVIDNLKRFEMIWCDFTGGKTQVSLLTCPLMEGSYNSEKPETRKAKSKPRHPHTVRAQYDNDDNNASPD